MEFRWNEEKNDILLKTRGIWFRDIVFSIEDWWLLDIEDSPKQEKYPWQILLYVMCYEYVYEVPAVFEWGDTYFLKTIYPSRKAKKRFNI